jgi:hypothetical protein
MRSSCLPPSWASEARVYVGVLLIGCSLLTATAFGAGDNEENTDNPVVAARAVVQGYEQHEDAPPIWERRIPVVAHSPGFGGTAWRTDVAAVNTTGAPATVTMTYSGSRKVSSTRAVLAAGESLVWRDRNTGDSD